MLMIWKLIVREFVPIKAACKHVDEIDHSSSPINQNQIEII